MTDIAALLEKYRLPLPVLERELSFETLRQLSMDILRDFWADDEDLQKIAPDFDTWMIETPLESVMVRLAAFGDMLFVAEMNDWARALLLAFFCFGSDLDKLAATEGLRRFEGEIDARLQERIVLTRRGKWGAGSDPWYIMQARNADVRVREVAITGNGRRRIEVAILSDEGDGTPSAELIAFVTAILNCKSVCRGNDLVKVVPAILVSPDITARIWLEPGASESILDGLAELVRAAWNNASDRLGRDLTVSWLTARLHVGGVYKVEVDLPALEAAPDRAIGIRSLTLEIAGRAR